MKDERFVYAATCTWFGSISETEVEDGIPRCPHCESVLFEYPNEKYWWDNVDRYDADHVGYRKFVEWLKGKHYPSYTTAVEAYKTETGNTIG